MPDGSVFVIGHIPAGDRHYVCVREMPFRDGSDLVERIMDGIYGKGRPSEEDIGRMGEPLDSHPYSGLFSGGDEPDEDEF